MYRAVRSYVDKDLVDEDHAIIVKRALYFGKYKYTLHFSPNVTNWTDFQELDATITELLSGIDYRMISSAKALYFNLYSNDPAALNLLRWRMSDSLEFSSIRVIDPSCWHIQHPRPKNRGPFYHKFIYRVRVSDGAGIPETIMATMNSPWTYDKVRLNFFYFSDVRDLIVFKLLHAASILDITERNE